MSALGQKQTFALQKVMSALPPLADIDRYSITSPGNSHDRVIHSVDCFPRLRVVTVFVILKLIAPFA
jgi:hypothetical protein